MIQTQAANLGIACPRISVMPFDETLSFPDEWETKDAGMVKSRIDHIPLVAQNTILGIIKEKTKEKKKK